MSTAHLLSGLDDREERLASMQTVLSQLGFVVKSYGYDVCDETHAFNAESQLSVRNGMQTSYCDKMAANLRSLPPGDVVIATADWHHLIFRGLLNLNDGRYEGTPVVELWVDYPGSFANWRVFSSYFILGYTMGQLGLETWSPRWIVADETAESLKPYMEQVTDARTGRRT